MQRLLVILIALAAVLGGVRLFGACLDVTPIIVEHDAYDPEAGCLKCLEQPEGCLDIIAACQADGANVYLAVPDDATELQAILTLAGSDVWVGVSDIAVEGSFVTVLGAAATFLPWAAGQPDNSGGGSDCVTALSASATYDDKRCSNAAIAVCECEP